MTDYAAIAADLDSAGIVNMLRTAVHQATEGNRTLRDCDLTIDRYSTVQSWVNDARARQRAAETELARRLG